MKNKINFITGETYTLSELFSGNHRIIIPDLQRDYCWGDKVHTDEKKELVSGFVNNLIHQFNNSQYKEFLNLGLLYGYEAPTNHIQLCDGQQRITTLYLLLGMLNRKTEDNVFRKYLISDYEYLQDDKEPYLQYSIRETSLYFLSDLVCHFFIKEKKDTYFVNNCEDIEQSTWFFNDYKYDPSIQSMIRALFIIDNIVNKKDKDWCREFGVFLTTKLTFMYYDMGNRKNGEETFVVINTTGEPLSSTQNLKPLILRGLINEHNKEMPEQWEDMETWFWRKRKASNGNDTADAGFNEFLRWITMLELVKSDKPEELKRILREGTYTFPHESISFEKIYSYWIIVKFLFESWEHREVLDSSYLSPKESETRDNHDIRRKVRIIGQIDCFQFLPLIAYCEKWKISDNTNRNLWRLYQFLHNLTRIDNVSKAVNDIVQDAVFIAKNCEDITGLLDCKDNVSQTIATQEEILKLEILQSHQNIRDEIEEEFWAVQNRKDHPNHHIWNGQILPLIEWSSESGKFDLEQFKKYVSIFDKTFIGQCEENIDIVRRALLSRSIPNYPRKFKGNTNYSFGWEWEDWSILINDNKDYFKAFFDDLLLNVSIQQMIDKFDPSKKWAEFVLRDYLLSYCKEKNIQWDDHQGWLLIQKQRATKYMSVNNLHLEKYLCSQLVFKDWKVWLYDETDGHVVVVENENKNLVFDILYIDNKWSVQFFKQNCEVEMALKPYVEDSWFFNGARYEKSIDFVAESYYSYPNIWKEIETIINKIN